MNTATSPVTKEILISRGLESFINGSYYEAAINFNEILSNLPNDPDALHHLAGCQIQLQEYGSAQETIQKSLYFDAKNSLAWFRLGQIHYTCKRYESAVDAFGKAIEIKPEFADAWFMGGQALIENGDINDGMLALKNALKFNPSSMIFNEVFGRQFIKYKKNVGRLIVSGGLEEILLCLPFLHENRELNLKVTVISTYKEVEALFKSKSILIDTITLCDSQLEVMKLNSQLSYSRECYSAPKQWHHWNS